MPLSPSAVPVLEKKTDEILVKKSGDRSLKLNATRRMQSILDNAVRKAHTESILLSASDNKVQALKQKTLQKSSTAQSDAHVDFSEAHSHATSQHETYIVDDDIFEPQDIREQITFSSYNDTPISRISSIHPVTHGDTIDIASPEESPREYRRSRSVSYDSPHDYTTPFQSPPSPPSKPRVDINSEAVASPPYTEYHREKSISEVSGCEARAVEDVSPYANFRHEVLGEKWLCSTISK